MPEKLRIGSMFSGYGGLDMAVQAVWPDSELAWVADPAPGPSKVLAHRHPDVPNLGDITTVDWATVAPVDIITGGSPCQDLSTAGRRAGMTDGTRSNLWVIMREAIHALRPQLVVWENVRGALSATASSDLEPCPGCVGDGADQPALRALGRVLGDLASLGYDAQWTGLRVSDLGGCHHRFRVFLLAFPADAERPQQRDATERGLRPEPRDGAGADRLTVLRTPTAQLAVNGGSQHPDKRRAGGHGPTLADEVEHLLPTPRASDGTKGGPNQRGSSGDLMLPSAVAQIERIEPCSSGYAGACGAPFSTSTSGREAGPRAATAADSSSSLPLLPTPTTQPTTGNGHARNLGTETASMLPTPRAEERMQHNSRDSYVALSAVADFGDYAPAIASHERLAGRPAPDPTEPGRNGQPRLSPRFVEWMMTLPDGWVTDVPGVTRNEQLALLGNGVVPTQAVSALRHLAILP